MNTDETRAAFEEWYKNKYGVPYKRHFAALAQEQLEAYQAATAAAEEKRLSQIIEMSVGDLVQHLCKATNLFTSDIEEAAKTLATLCEGGKAIRVKEGL